MGKTCPGCGIILIRKYNLSATYSELAFSKRYDCRWKCGNSYIFCIICRFTMRSEFWSSHHLKAHMVNLMINRNNHFFIYYEGEIISYDYGNILQSLYKSNPQLSSLTLLRSVSYENSRVMKMHYDDVVELIRDNVFNNDYKCFFCDCYYDSFPTNKMARVHLKTCEGAKQIGQTLKSHQST